MLAWCCTVWINYTTTLNQTNKQLITGLESSDVPRQSSRKTKSVRVTHVRCKCSPMVRSNVRKPSSRILHGNRLMAHWCGRSAIFKKRSVGLSNSASWTILCLILDLVDARSERQRSIYSQCFYSSPTGYKMRLRLFLNGTNTGRDTHLSLFFVLMRGEFDALLTWPFGYKVTFCLLEQCSSDDHPRRLSQCFWPDTSLNCFQRPQSDMNEAYGIEKLIPLEQLRADHPSRYMENDTIFIQAEVDFESRRPSKFAIKCL